MTVGSARPCLSIRHGCSFLCVILERSEESRSLFFGLFFVSFRAAAAKNPASVFSSVQHSRLKNRDSSLRGLPSESHNEGLRSDDTKTRNLESRRALYSDPHLRPLPGRERRQTD